MSNQSIVIARCGMIRGWMTTPAVIVSATSGLRFGLPPIRPLYWPAGLPGICWPTLRPCAIQPASEARMTWPAHGSALPLRATRCGANSSWMFGARTARLYAARKRMSRIGEISTPIF
jgi:hypothetical protein